MARAAHRFALGTGAEPIGEINTTPLIDVMLVLLIMFIITLPMTTHKVPIDLPQGPAVPQQEQVRHRLAISADGALALDGGQVSIATLDARLAALRANPRAELDLETSPDARYDVFAQTLAAVKRAGITRLGFVGNAPTDR